MNATRLLLVATLLGVVVLTWLRASRDDASNESVQRVARDERAPEPAHGPSSPADVTLPAEVERTTRSDEPVPEATSDDEPARWSLSVRLEEADTGAPVGGVLLWLALAGSDTAKSGYLPLALRTGADGHASTDELEGRGPWNVYFVGPSLEGVPVDPFGTRRLASVAARRVLGEPEVLTVRFGPGVVVDTPLPDGVAATDLWFELRSVDGKVVRRSFDWTLARGRADEDGAVVARFPPLTRGRMRGAQVTVTNELGTVGFVQRFDELVGPMTRLRCTEPFVELGRVRFEVELVDVREERDAELVERAARHVAFAPLVDGDLRLGGVLSGRLVHVSEAVFEWRGLPTVPFEVGAVAGVLHDQREPELEPVTLLRTTAAPDPREPVTLRVRVLR